jgi:hypothetical protein
MEDETPAQLLIVAEAHLRFEGVKKKKVQKRRDWRELNVPLEILSACTPQISPSEQRAQAHVFSS